MENTRHACALDSDRNGGLEQHAGPTDLLLFQPGSMYRGDWPVEWLARVQPSDGTTAKWHVERLVNQIMATDYLGDKAMLGVARAFIYDGRFLVEGFLQRLRALREELMESEQIRDRIMTEHNVNAPSVESPTERSDHYDTDVIDWLSEWISRLSGNLAVLEKYKQAAFYVTVASGSTELLSSFTREVIVVYSRLDFQWTGLPITRLSNLLDAFSVAFRRGSEMHRMIEAMYQ